jgi:CrcB protein
MNAGWTQALAVATGAAAGGLLRWRVGVWFAGWAGAFPLGTLIVNLAGGLLVGAALAVFERQPQELWRLLLVTGFLGGLTTFSAFSAESLQLMLRGQWAWALIHTLAHVLGALAFAALGWALMRGLLA